MHAHADGKTVLDYYRSGAALGLVKQHMSFIAKHANAFSGLPFKDDPTIMVWYGVVPPHAGACCLLPWRQQLHEAKPGACPVAMSAKLRVQHAQRPEGSWLAGLMHRPRQRAEAKARSCTQCSALPGCRVVLHVCLSSSLDLPWR